MVILKIILIVLALYVIGVFVARYLTKWTLKFIEREPAVWFLSWFYILTYGLYALALWIMNTRLFRWVDGFDLENTRWGGKNWK